MPVKIRTVRGVPRIVEAATGRIAKGQGGGAMDGGPRHGRSGSALERQARAVNASLSRRGKGKK